MKRLLSVILLLNTLVATSQESSGKFKIQSFYFSIDNLHFKDNYTDLNELRTLVTNNEEIFDVNLDGFNYSSGIQNYQRELNIAVGILPNKHDKNQEIVLGLNYQFGYRSNLHYFKERVIPADTSIISDISIISDTSIQTSYSFRLEIVEFGLNLTKLYKSDPDKKISLFAGFGAAVNYSLFSNIEAQYFIDTSLLYYVNNNQIYQTEINHPIYDDSYFKFADSKSSISLKPYIPIGISCIVSKKHVGLNQIQLFVHSKFGMEYQYVFNHKNYLRPFIGIGGGIRYQITA